ncbi:E3 ubiquitin-protein ligase pub23-like protein [Trifolium pratense]|uniref:U-box domain-containing protein n=1 Tax=Trifolium pratense TaxID=57577 RepID=A0A2K3N296_TRIPR|nr:E3 ubiquitin-protein ligase pub23-like protein [Trifolium pratense]
MKDPVTAITGITYDRESIEHWLFRNKNTTCPVTKQPLPLDSDLTPNHTLRRLIQSWCTQNASFGIDRIPTPKPPLNKTHVQKLLKEMTDSRFQLKSLMQLELLAAENERNRKCLLENGVPKSMIMFLVDCYKKGEILEGIEEALSFLQFVKVPTEEVKNLLSENDQILDSLTWILSSEVKNSVAVKSHAVIVLKRFINKCDSILLERLKPEFFEKIVNVLKHGVLTQQGLCSALHVLLCCCPLGRNRLMMVEVGLVHELIEIELTAAHEKRITELTFGILFHLCSCANGRFQFLSHEGSIAVLTERIMKGSMTVDDRGVFILSLISKFSATKNVLDEMLKVGTVKKLFVLLQGDHAKYLKDKVMQMFKAHSEVWKNSPCFPQTSFYAS